MRTVMASGGFDPVHVGHLAYLDGAKQLGDYLVVAVDDDAYVSSKRRVLMPQLDRARVVSQLRMVDSVLAVHGERGVCDLLEQMRPEVYAVGPDYRDSLESIPEFSVCKKLGIKIVVVEHQEKVHSRDLIGYDNPPIIVNAMIVRKQDDHDEVLLGVRGHRDGNGKLEFIGGFVEKGETLELALLREVREEIGITALLMNYHSSDVGTYSDGRKLVAVTFKCDTCGQQPKPTSESPETLWVKKCPPRNLMFADCDYQVLSTFLGTRERSWRSE